MKGSILCLTLVETAAEAVRSSLIIEMPKEIDVDALRALLERGGPQLVEVLPGQEYAEEHLPGAINIPLKSLDADAVSGLDRSRPIVVYCWDEL